tara:strand:+ start:122 stop:472 length:351 start_codon:yes stop_codon:yes gene_type:complete
LNKIKNKLRVNMTTQELYDNCKKELNDILDTGETKLIILSGSGRNGKTTLLNDLKNKISDKKFTVLNEITKQNLINLKNNFDFSNFKYLIFEISENLDDITQNPSFLHINMNNITF